MRDREWVQGRNVGEGTQSSKRTTRTTPASMVWTWSPRSVLVLWFVLAIGGCQLGRLGPLPLSTIAVTPVAPPAGAVTLTARQAFPDRGTWVYDGIQGGGKALYANQLTRTPVSNGFTESGMASVEGHEAIIAPVTYVYDQDGVVAQGQTKDVVFPASLTPGDSLQDANGGSWRAESWVRAILSSRTYTCLLVKHAPAGKLVDGPDSSEDCFAPGIGLIYENYQVDGQPTRRELASFSLGP